MVPALALLAEVVAAAILMISDPNISRSLSRLRTTSSLSVNSACGLHDIRRKIPDRFFQKQKRRIFVPQELSLKGGVSCVRDRDMLEETTPGAKFRLGQWHWMVIAALLV